MSIFSVRKSKALKKFLSSSERLITKLQRPVPTATEKKNSKKTFFAKREENLRKQITGLDLTARLYQNETVKIYH